MRNLRTSSLKLVLVAAVLSAPAGAAFAATLSREDALKALSQPAASQRLAAVQRLAEVGTMADAERVAPILKDENAVVREQAVAAMWQIWSRSGDASIDKLFARGLAQMQAARLDEALATFDEIVQRLPGFAEGWNKRATVHYLLGHYQESLKDVDETLKRNRYHFGALSGAGQIHMRLGHLQEALDFFRRTREVNPNQDGLDEIIEILEQHVRERTRRMI